MKIQSYKLILLLLLSNIVFAQKLELGKVTLAELEEKQHPTESDAVAAVLFKKGVVKFEYSENNGFEMITIVKVKIKIYKREGYNYANFSQRYYIGTNSKETVDFSDAITYNIVNGKIEKTKLKNEGIFDEKVNRFWKRKKITMPNVKEGSIIEFEYRITSNQIGTIDEWEFQSDIPVNHSEFTTFIPEYFVYNPNLKGYIFPKVTTEKSRSSIIINSKERVIAGGIFKSQFDSDKIDFEETVTNYVAQNFPALKDEAFVNNINNYRSSVLHELTMTKFPNAPFKQYSTDWEAVTKTIYKYDDFGAELNKTGYFEDEINTLVSKLSTREEKIGAIFSFVKSKVKWNEYYGYTCNDGVKKAYKDGVGNVAEINLMLTAMLRFVGFDANPVLLSTRSNGIALFPNTSAFNYVIASVKTDSGIILLDATEKNSLPNILPIRDLNWYGRLIRKDETSEQIELTSPIISKSNLTAILTISSDGTVDGKLRNQEFDYNAYNYRNRVEGLSNDDYSDKLEKKFPGIEISNLEIKNKSELAKQIIEDYSFKHTNSTEIIGDKIYFSPLLFFAETENPFKTETRKYPIDFVYPNQNTYNLVIKFPEDYMVETLPKSIVMPFSDNLLNFKYTISNSNNQIYVSAITDINTAIIPADYYEDLKAYYTELVKRETEKIVLKKK
jgi:hypothetical protein